MIKKILLFGANYHPEPIGIPRYTTEMAENMAMSGNAVTVICAAPLYPDWKKQTGYRYWWYSTEIKNSVKVIRVPTYVPRNSGFGQRIIYEIFFLTFSLPIVLFKIFRGLNNLIITVPPIALCLIFFLVPKDIHKTVIVKDMQVDIAKTLGIIKNRFILNFLFFVEKKLLSKANLVTAVSENMLASLRGRGIGEANSSFFPDWVDGNKLKNATSDQVQEMRSRIGLPIDKLLVGYSGNLARKQGVDLILEIALKFQVERRADVHFLICGDGPTKEDLINGATRMQLSNVTFIPLVTELDLPILLSLIDVHFVPQRDEVSDLVMPGKIFNIMSCSRPIVITAPLGSSIDKVMAKSGAGLRFDRYDIDGIFNGIDYLLRDPGKRAAMGQSGRAYILNELSIDKVLNRFYSELSTF
jgi:colanic acid biosynthesis glycosyl transferase WcaI